MTATIDQRDRPSIDQNALNFVQRFGLFLCFDPPNTVCFEGSELSLVDLLSLKVRQSQLAIRQGIGGLIWPSKQPQPHAIAERRQKRHPKMTDGLRKTPSGWECNAKTNNMYAVITVIMNKKRV